MLLLNKIFKKKNKILLKEALKIKEDLFHQIGKLEKSLAYYNKTQKEKEREEAFSQLEQIAKKYSKICKIILKANLKSGQNEYIKLRELLNRRKYILLEMPSGCWIPNPYYSPLSKKLIPVQNVILKTKEQLKEVSKKQEEINNKYYVKI
jgi:hypothetical protein